MSQEKTEINRQTGAESSPEKESTFQATVRNSSKTQNKNRRWIYAAILLAGILLLAGNSYYRKIVLPEKEAVHYILTYAENQTVNYPTIQGARYLADLVKERTDGRIEIVVIPDAELGDETDVLQQIRFGGIDMARVSLSQISELMPEYNVLQLPYLYEDADHMWRVLKSSLGEEFLENTHELGIEGLSWYDAGVRSFYTTKKPITCIEDFKGMKIRVQESSMMVDMVNALGAQGMEVPYSDVYSYLERGLVDGAENNWASYETMLHYEVAPYYIEDEHNRIPEMQIISTHTWEQFTPEDQQIIREAARESAEYEHSLWKESAQLARERAIEAGAQVVAISAEEEQKIQDAVSLVYDKYCSDQKEIIEEIRNMR